MIPVNLGCTLALFLFLGLGGGAISFAEEPAEHWLIGVWQEKDSGALVMTSGVEPDGTALGTIGPNKVVQVKAEIKVEGSRVRIVSESGTVIEAARTSGGDLSGTLTVPAGTRWSVTFVKMQRCTDGPLLVGSQSYGPPKYCVGDTWTYSNRTIQRVVEVESEKVVMTGTFTPGISCSGCLITFDRDLVLRSITRADGKPLEVQNISRGYIPVGDGWRYWDFPLTVGKKWRLSGKGFVNGFNSAVKNYTVDFKVEAYEDVTVTAGTFKAFRISRNWNRYQIQVESTNWSDTVWFAPEVKATVKLALPTGDGVSELVSYSLKDFAAPSRRD